jgi:hypothetical protein
VAESIVRFLAEEEGAANWVYGFNPQHLRAQVCKRMRTPKPLPTASLWICNGHKRVRRLIPPITHAIRTYLPCPMLPLNHDPGGGIRGALCG